MTNNNELVGTERGEIDPLEVLAERLEPARYDGLQAFGESAALEDSYRTATEQTNQTLPPKPDAQRLKNRLLLIDNYDSFTYNIHQYLSELGAEVHTRRNDQVTLPEIETMSPDGIVISPGPGAPAEAGISNDAIRLFGPRIPTLGVCLGHQCFAQVYGARVGRANEIYHGKTSLIRHNGAGILRGLPDPFPGMRYHSLAVYPETVPDALEITARAESGLIMALRHKQHPIESVQFHPESIMTPNGKQLLQNYLNVVARHSPAPPNQADLEKVYIKPGNFGRSRGKIQ